MRHFAFALLLFPLGQARAQIEDEPTPRPAAVAEASFRAVRGRAITLRLGSGQELSGQLLGDDAATVTVAIAPGGDVVTVPKREVTALRLTAPPAAPVAPGAPVAAAAPGDGSTTLRASGAAARERTFGVNLGLAPALTLDVQAGLFYGFASASLVLPLASDGNLNGIAFGGGVSFRVSHSSAWRFDIFAHLTPAELDKDWLVGFGVGIGLHYTFSSGFTLAFKAPVLGYSVEVRNGSGRSVSAGEAVAYYYLSGVMGLPVISLGYRF